MDRWRQFSSVRLWCAQYWCANKILKLSNSTTTRKLELHNGYFFLLLPSSLPVDLSRVAVSVKAPWLSRVLEEEEERRRRREKAFEIANNNNLVEAPGYESLPLIPLGTESTTVLEWTSL